MPPSSRSTSAGELIGREAGAERVKAILGGGHVDRITSAIARLEDIAARSHIPFLGIQVECARRLLAGGDAEELVTTALAGSVHDRRAPEGGGGIAGRANTGADIADQARRALPGNFG